MFLPCPPTTTLSAIQPAFLYIEMKVCVVLEMLGQKQQLIAGHCVGGGGGAVEHLF